MTYTRRVGRGADVWRCERCGHEIVCLDIDVVESAPRAQARRAA
jgi:hypothetical protein